MTPWLLTKLYISKSTTFFPIGVFPKSPCRLFKNTVLKRVSLQSNLPFLFFSIFVFLRLNDVWGPPVSPSRIPAGGGHLWVPHPFPSANRVHRPLPLHSSPGPTRQRHGPLDRVHATLAVHLPRSSSPTRRATPARAARGRCRPMPRAAPCLLCI